MIPVDANGWIDHEMLAWKCQWSDIVMKLLCIGVIIMIIDMVFEPFKPLIIVGILFIISAVCLYGYLELYDYWYPHQFDWDDLFPRTMALARLWRRL